MNEEVLDITFAKLYEEIDNVAYDCEDILDKLLKSGLINDKGYQNIRNQREKIEKDKWV